MGTIHVNGPVSDAARPENTGAVPSGIQHGPFDKKSSFREGRRCPVPIRFLSFRYFFSVCALSLVLSGFAFYVLKKEIEDSEFIRGIYKRKLPASVPFYLFFSFRGNCSQIMQNNDGAVELASELHYRAQADDAGIFGLNEDPDGILKGPKFLDEYIQVLASHESRR